MTDKTARPAATAPTNQPLDGLRAIAVAFLLLTVAALFVGFVVGVPALQVVGLSAIALVAVLLSITLATYAIVNEIRKLR